MHAITTLMCFCMHGHSMADWRLRWPGTVLTTLIRNGLLPDPDVGLAHGSIPDIHHAGRDRYKYWFCTSIAAPHSWPPRQGDQATLVLHGINYSARSVGAGSTLLQGRFMELSIASLLSHYGMSSQYMSACIWPVHSAFLYRVFINDEEIFGERPIKGMYLAHCLDITPQLARAAANGSCQLSILVSPPDHVGCVDKGCACP